MRCGASELSDIDRAVCAERAQEATAHDTSEIAALTSWLLKRHPHWLDPAQPIDTVLQPPRLDLDHWLRIYSAEYTIRQLINNILDMATSYAKQLIGDQV